MDSLTAYLKRAPIAYLTIAFIAGLFYFNTLNSGFALDDGLVYTDNTFVTSGFSGISDIFTHDSFYGTLGGASELNGGRYRPLSLAMFAVEYQIWGKDPFVHHLINVLCYMLLCMLIYRFLAAFVFKTNSLAAWVATLLFAIHPIHTEVVANIKSRDELLSLILLIFTLHNTLSYAINRKIISLILAVICFALALLAKENGLTFLFIIPMTLYFFTDKSPRFIVLTSLPFVAVVAAYIGMRIGLIGFKGGTVTEVMDNPYVLATTQQKFATIMYVLLYYLRLLVWPHPLTFDYGYNQIPYRTFSDVWVIISILIHVGLLAYAFATLRQKNILSYCIFFYLFSMFIVSNIAINIGAPLGERFLFQPSVFFAVAIVVLFKQASKYFATTSVGIATVLLCIIGLAAYGKTYTRNKDWSDGVVLGMHDVHTSTNSARANTYAGVNLIHLCDSAKTDTEKTRYLRESLIYFRKARDIQPRYISTFQNMGVAYYRLGIFDSARYCWNVVRSIEPNSNTLKEYDYYLRISDYNKFYKIGLNYGAKKQYDSALYYLRTAVHDYDKVAQSWYDLGGSYYSVNKFDSARYCWEHCLKLNPNHTQAKQGLAFLTAQHK